MHLFARGLDELETMPFVFEEPSPPCLPKGIVEEVKGGLEKELEIEVSCLYLSFQVRATMHT